jgi:hypothetical protein
MRAADIQACIAESSPRTAGTFRGKSGGVEFDVVVDADGTELIALDRLCGLVSETQVDVRLLRIDITGVGLVRVVGEFGGIAYRNFLEFVITLCPLLTLQVRSDVVHTMVLMSDVSSRFSTG